MAHFLGAELTKELENLNDNVNTNVNVDRSKIKEQTNKIMRNLKIQMLIQQMKK